MAREITGLLTRRRRQSVVDGTGESEEVDFDIPQGMAIKIYGFQLWVATAALDGAEISMETLVDLDGNALASNSLATQALFEAREILDSSIAYLGIEADNITTGAAKTSDSQMQWFPFGREIITARNPGIGWLSVGASGEGKVCFYYSWVTISTREFGQLVSARRA